jgi:integrase
MVTDPMKKTTMQNYIPQQCEQITHEQAVSVVNYLLGKLPPNVLQFIRSLQDNGVANIDNLITIKEASAKIFFKIEKEEKDFMRLNKGMRRHPIYSHYEWRQTIKGVPHCLTDPNPYELAKKVRSYKKEIEKNNKAKIKTKESRKLIDLCVKNVQLYKSGNTTKRSYESVLKNHLQCLTHNIETYTKDDIQKFFNNLAYLKKQINYIWFIVRDVFADAHASGLIKTNPIANMKSPAKNSKPKEWIDLKGQQEILANLDNCKIGDEILFYLLTGCRCEEAFHTTINWDNKTLFIDGTKTNNAPRYMRISQKFCDYFKTRWNRMFQCQPHYYSKFIGRFLKEIGLADKSLHCLRHSFSTNLYYLGVNQKKHQYLMGHKDIKTTYNIYTSYDPTVTRQDVLNVWGDWYPQEFGIVQPKI